LIVDWRLGLCLKFTRYRYSYRGGGGRGRGAGEELVVVRSTRAHCSQLPLATGTATLLTFLYSRAEVFLTA